MTDPVISDADLLVAEIESAALQLPREQRARLAGLLLANLEPESEIDRAWPAEIRERVRAFGAGELKTIPIEETLDEVDELLR